jgi:hypothetical protein
VSTALADQISAAMREARSIVDHAAEATAFERVDALPGPFVQSVLRDLHRADKRGRLRRCRHLSGRGPSPVWVVACKPGRIWCVRCVFVVLHEIRGSAEDTRCDICRREAPKLWSAIGAAGAVLLSYGACADCYTTETGRVAA